MTEHEWITGIDPRSMLAFVGTKLLHGSCAVRGDSVAPNASCTLAQDALEARLLTGCRPIGGRGHVLARLCWAANRLRNYNRGGERWPGTGH